MPATFPPGSLRGRSSLFDGDLCAVFLIQSDTLSAAA